MTDLFSPEPDPEFDDTDSVSSSVEEQKRRRGLAELKRIRDDLRASRADNEATG